MHVVEAGCWCRCRVPDAGAGRVLAPLPVLSAGKAHRSGGAVSWLCRLRTFLFQPVACQQVVGFCLAIWVYAGVIYFFFVLPKDTEKM